jgi:pimeloyl-ACP methyl ester carboxylesterase
MVAVREGELNGGLPYLAFGEGPPLVVFPGLGSHNGNPTGVNRRLEVSTFSALAERFTVFDVNRRPGLAPGTTIKDLSDSYAEAVKGEFSGPVDVLGLSTGGSIAQRFAVDHPTLVRRLVLLVSAYRLSDVGRAVQRTLAERSAAGKPRQAWAAIGSALAATPATAAIAGSLFWLVGPLLASKDPTDMIATIDAEDDFDISADLSRITAPTLVIGGERDGFYGGDHIRATADLIPGARLILYPRKGHIGTVSHKPVMTEIIRFLAGQP